MSMNNKQNLLLDRVRMQWLFGDWESISSVGIDALEDHPKRDEIALLIGSAHQHIGNTKEAREFLGLSKKWGCRKQRISRVLSSDAHNAIARAAVISGDYKKAFEHFQEAVRGVNGDERLAFQARALWEISALRGQSESIAKITNETAKDLLESERSLRLIQEDIGYIKQNGKVLDYKKKDEYPIKQHFSTFISLPSGKIEVELVPLNIIDANDFLLCEEPFVFFSLPKKNHIYLSNSRNNDFEKPPEEELLTLKPGCEYCLTGTSAIFGASTINLWLIEYSNKKRLSHKQIKLYNGKIEIKWTTHHEHKKLLIAIRLQDEGILLLSDLSISEIPIDKESNEPLYSTEQHPSLSRDRIAQAYLGLWGGSVTQEKSKNRINWMASQVEGNKILDVGCSEGILAILLGREGYKVTGIDVNEEALSYARELLYKENEFVQKRVRFVHGDFIEADLEKQGFDTVILGEVLEHLVKPESMLENVNAHLKKNGLLVLTTPYGFFPHEDHKQTFKLNQLINLLKNRKFSPEHLSIVDGYIRFIGLKSEIIDNRSWEEILDQSLIDIAEQEIIVQQKQFWTRNESIKKNIEEMKSRVSNLENDLNFVYAAETKLQKYTIDMIRKFLEVR